MSSQLLQLQNAILPQETTPPLLGSHAAADEDDHSNVSMAMIQYRLTSHIEIMSGGRLRGTQRYRETFLVTIYIQYLTNNDASLFVPCFYNRTTQLTSSPEMTCLLSSSYPHRATPNPNRHCHRRKNF